MDADPDPEEMPTTVDVLKYGDEDPRYLTVPGDDGTKVVGAHARQEVHRKRLRLLAVVVLAGVAAAVGAYLSGGSLAAGAAAVVLTLSAVYEFLRSDRVPEVVGRNVHASEALETYDVEGYVDEVFVEE
jgi:hypothetical protein